MGDPKNKRKLGLLEIESDNRRAVAIEIMKVLYEVMGLHQACGILLPERDNQKEQQKLWSDFGHAILGEDCPETWELT